MHHEKKERAYQVLAVRRVWGGRAGRGIWRPEPSSPGVFWILQLYFNPNILDCKPFKDMDCVFLAFVSPPPDIGPGTKDILNVWLIIGERMTKIDKPLCYFRIESATVSNHECFNQNYFYVGFFLLLGNGISFMKA